MTTVSKIEAESRQGSGTGQARAVRLEGKVPGIIYGGDKAPELCAINAKTLGQELHRPGFYTKIFNIVMGGKEQQVIAKDIQLHPVTDQPLHIDFMRVSKDTRVTVAVPVHFINEDKAPGIKKGGVLTISIRNLELIAPATAIPNEVVVDLAGFEIHDSVHIDDLTFGKGVTPAHPERDYTLATITAPSTETAGKQGEAGATSNE